MTKQYGHRIRVGPGVACLLSLLLLPVNSVVESAPVPIGPSSWRKPDGSIQKAIGPAGPPVLNYQRADGSWDHIADDWVRVGQRQEWESVRAPHRVWTDSSGTATYAKAGHYLTTKTTHLIKFNKRDSTWQTLRSRDPDSVTAEGNRVTFHNIFPGIDKILENRARGFQSYAERFTFHQDARDSIARWGPWVDHLLGTATRLGTDSLNLTWRDTAGAFGFSTKGRLTDGWLGGHDGVRTVFYIAEEQMRTVDSVVAALPIHKLVIMRPDHSTRTNVPYLVELFDPLRAAQLPAGDLWHYSRFGETDSTLKTVQFLSCENKAVGSPFVCPDNGTVDSITAVLDNTAPSQSINARFVLMAWLGPDTTGACVDSTATFSVAPGDDRWNSQPTNDGGALAADSAYWIWSNAFTNFTGDVRQGYFSSMPSSDTITSESQSFAGGGGNPCDDTDALTVFSGFRAIIYATYTVTGGSTPSRRRQLILQNSGIMEEARKHFAGSYDEIPD